MEKQLLSYQVDEELVATAISAPTVILTQLDADEKTAWILAFGVLLAVATVGNSIVTWYIIGNEHFR